MNPGEVLNMGDKTALVFTPKTDPLRLKTYTWHQFVDEMAIPPVRRKKLEVDERLVKTCSHAEKTPEWQAEWVKTDPPELDYIRKNIEDTTEKVEMPAEIQTNQAQQKASPKEANLKAEKTEEKPRERTKETKRGYDWEVEIAAPPI